MPPAMLLQGWTPDSDTQGLQGPPPQPMQPETEPSVTSVRVRNRPAPSEVAPMNLKKFRREDLRARTRVAAPVSVSVIRGCARKAAVSPAGTGTAGRRSATSACTEC